MSNDADEFDPTKALRILGEACANATAGQGGDTAKAFSNLEQQLQDLAPADRANVEKALRKILNFRPPQSRSEH